MYILPHEEEALEIVKQYIDRVVPGRIDIDDLVELSGLTKTKLTRGFRIRYNDAIYQYWLKRSMKIAKMMIEDGTKVKDVSSILKYCSTGSFARAFRLVYKRNPAEFKKQ